MIEQIELTALAEPLRIGVIADTHGWLRQEALAALRGSHLILHAGDIGKPEVLTGLGTLGRVIAVRGNVDRSDWVLPLPSRVFVRFSDQCILLSHQRPEAVAVDDARTTVVVFGHSHRPHRQREPGRLHFNPGSAGPRRFHLPVTVGRLLFREGEWHSEIIDLPT